MKEANKKIYRVQITYPGIEVCIDSKEDLELAKPNLRYMLNDMKNENHYCSLSMCTSFGKEEKKVSYNEEGENFSIYDKEWGDFYGEPYNSKDCLDELFSIISDWVEDDCTKEEK